MNFNRVSQSLMILFVLAFLGTEGFAADATSSSEDGKGMTVLARGPVHEAFAQPSNPRPLPSAVIAKQPPAPLPEVPPEEQPTGKEVQWVPGYWDWDEDKKDFLWVSGLWRVTPPQRKWVPGYWSQSTDGWQWVSGFWAPADQKQIQYLSPPPAAVDHEPSVPAPPNSSSYAPGNWVFRDNRYIWRPGYWYDCQPGWVWIPGYYLWTPAGYVFVEGYWDYSLEDRGLLYVPVYFDQPLWTQANWCYKPRYVANLTCLIDTLFFRPGCSCYCFGNYYSAACRTRGYRPWCYQGPACFDPLYNYYAFINRGNRLWERGLCDRFRARFQGTAISPAVTFREQIALLRQTALLKANNAQNLNLVSSLHQHDRKLVTKTPASQLNQQQSVASHFRQVIQARGHAEQRGIGFKTTPSAPNGGAVVHTFRLPAYPVVSQAPVPNGPTGSTVKPATTSAAAAAIPRSTSAPPIQVPRNATPAAPPRSPAPAQPRTVLPALIQSLRPPATNSPRPSPPANPSPSGRSGKP